MKCTLCKEGETGRGRVTITVEREGTVVVVREVPAEVCANCGEYYLAEGVAAKVLSEGEAAAARHTEVEILRYAA